MKLFFKFITYLFHPILIPLAGTVMYFLITPKYASTAFQNGNVLPIFILSVVIPLIAILILKNVGVINSISDQNVTERKYLLYVGISLLLMIVYKVLPNYFVAELHFYFVGLLVAIFCALMLLFINFKCSIHMIGMGSLLMYLICLSVHFETNIIISLSIITLITGLVATSRLYLQSNGRIAILVGFLIGLISQIMTVKFWL